ncbi:MAG: Dabb family protein [Pseudomonadota bacterium]
MIIHIGLLTLADPAGEDIADVMEGLAALRGRLSGMLEFEHGPNIDAEGLSPDCDYGFVVRFQDRAALQAYADDDEHKAIGVQLLALCKGGIDGLMVVDLDLSPNR